MTTSTTKHCTSTRSGLRARVNSVLCCCVQFARTKILKIEMRRYGNQSPEYLVPLFVIAVVAAVAQPIYTRYVQHATENGIVLSLRDRLVTLGIAILIGIAVLLVIVCVFGALFNLGIYLYERYGRKK